MLNCTLTRALCAVGLALAAGCGTTTHLTGSDASGGPSGATGLAGGPVGSSVLGSSRGGSRSTAGGSQYGLPTGSPASSTTGNPTSVPTTSGVVLGPGITTTTISIGYPYPESANTVAAQFGLSAVAGSGVKLLNSAMADYINKHGGVLGRRLNLIPFVYKVDDTDNDDQRQSKECSAWTEDSHVFAVVLGAQPDNILRTCLDRAGASLIAEVGGPTDASMFAKGHYYQLTNTTYDISLTASIPSFAAAGYFKDVRKLGIVSGGNDVTKASERHLEAMLARYGVHNPEVIELGGATAGDAEASISSAALKFHTDGVDHVLFSEASEGQVPFFFMQYAQGQKYFPRYALTPYNEPGTVNALAVSANDQKQLHNAVAITVAPLGDIGKYFAPLPPAYDTCLSIMKAEGVPPDDNDISTFMNVCTAFLMIKTGLEHAGRTLTSDGLARGIAAAAATFSSGDLYTWGMSAGRHFAPNSYRPLVYSDAKETWAPSGPVTRFRD